MAEAVRECRIDRARCLLISIKVSHMKNEGAKRREKTRYALNSRRAERAIFWETRERVIGHVKE